MAQHLHNGKVRVQNLDTFVVCLVTPREQIAIYKYINSDSRFIYSPNYSSIYAYRILGNFQGKKFLRIDPLRQ